MLTRLSGRGLGKGTSSLVPSTLDSAAASAAEVCFVEPLIGSGPEPGPSRNSEPQRLKPPPLARLCGTTKVVPFPQPAFRAKAFEIDAPVEAQTEEETFFDCCQR